MRLFCRKNPMSIKFLVLGGGGVFWVLGGGSADFIFMDARIFLSFWKSLRVEDVRAFGSWMSADARIFLTEFGRLIFYHYGC